jgi:hypothetical protein
MWLTLVTTNCPLSSSVIPLTPVTWPTFGWISAVRAFASESKNLNVSRSPPIARGSVDQAQTQLPPRRTAPAPSPGITAGPATRGLTTARSTWPASKANGRCPLWSPQAGAVTVLGADQQRPLQIRCCG